MNTCKNCIHYDYHNGYKDFGFCKRYNLNVNSNYFCKSFLQYAADFVKQYHEKSMNKFEKALQQIADKKEKELETIEDEKNDVCKSCSSCYYMVETYDNIPTCLKYGKDLTGLNRFVTQCSDGYRPKENNNKTMNDPIKPDHYKQGKLTCKEICESMCANKVGIEAGYVFNVTKYMYRYNMKDGINDVRKAREYCDFLIAHLEEKETE